MLIANSMGDTSPTHLAINRRLLTKLELLIFHILFTLLNLIQLTLPVDSTPPHQPKQHLQYTNTLYIGVNLVQTTFTPPHQPKYHLQYTNAPGWTLYSWLWINDTNPNTTCRILRFLFLPVLVSTFGHCIMHWKKWYKKKVSLQAHRSLKWFSLLVVNTYY